MTKQTALSIAGKLLGVTPYPYQLHAYPQRGPARKAYLRMDLNYLADVMVRIAAGEGEDEVMREPGS